MSEKLIEALLTPSPYPHDAGEITLVETHISWVILTGSYVYKIKKPVDFGFLDFSSLEKRRFYCEEELRLNSRFSDTLYLGVVPITGSEENPRIGGDNGVLEYAVKMRQFDQDGLLDRLALKGALHPTDIQTLAIKLARFHTSLAEPLEEMGKHYGSLEAIRGAAMDNIHQVEPLLDGEQDDKDRLSRLKEWTVEQCERLEPVFVRRKETGCVRECHGDMHFGNIARIDGEITFFDCIEFNPDLRWIDIMSETAFLLMDMEEKDLPQAANHLLNTYLEFTGDYGGLAVLDFYKVYRAMVKAKVNLLRVAGDEELDDTQVRACWEGYRKYLSLAESYLKPRSRFLAIMHGVSGTGKSSVAGRLAGEVGAIRIRSDVERKRLFGLPPDAGSHSEKAEGIYTEEASHRTLTRLEELAEQLLGMGFPVIVDATFIQRKWRAPFLDLAQRMKVPFAILDCQADEAVILERLEKRARQGDGISEAGVEIMRSQMENLEPFTAEEKPHWIPIDTQAPITPDPLHKLINP